MANFQLKKTVWLHNRPWRPGSEDALQNAGFTREQKGEQLRRKALVMLGGAQPEPEKSLEDHTVTELRKIADEKSIDLGKARRKADIIKAIEAGPQKAGDDSKADDKKTGEQQPGAGSKDSGDEKQTNDAE